MRILAGKSWQQSLTRNGTCNAHVDAHAQTQIQEEDRERKTNFILTCDCIIFRIEAILQLHLLSIVILVIVIIVKVALSVKGHQFLALANRSSLNDIARRDLTLC